MVIADDVVVFNYTRNVWGFVDRGIVDAMFPYPKWCCFAAVVHVFDWDSKAWGSRENARSCGVAF